MTKNIIFFNPYNLGDIHISRNLVKHITESTSSHCYYAHRHPKLLQDIPKLIEDNNLMQRIGNRIHDDYFVDNGRNIFLNTWFHAGGGQHSRYGTTIDSLCCLFESHCRKLGIPKLGLLDSYPDIDFSYYDVGGIKEYMQDKKNNIFIFNGLCRSQQSENFPMGNAINNLTSKFPDKNFFITNQDPIIQKRDNVYFTWEIINKGTTDGCDLNETAYLSTFCDVIIGRASGAFSYCGTKYNYFNRDCIVVPICSIVIGIEFFMGQLFLQNGIRYRAKIIKNNIRSEGEFEAVIYNVLKEI